MGKPSGDAPLLIKRAKLGKTPGEPGVLTVSRQSLNWTPNDPGAAQQAATVAVSVITSERPAVHAGPPHDWT